MTEVAVPKSSTLHDLEDWPSAGKAVVKEVVKEAGTISY